VLEDSEDMGTRAAPDGRIVVAVGNSAATAAALRWAAAEASRRETTLAALYVVERGHWPVHEERRAALETARRELPERVGRALGWVHADVAISVRVVCGPLVDCLLRHARGAALLVVGQPTARAHRNLPGRLADRADCPVVVIDERGAAATVRSGSLARPV
jgi:nucleotide-binding universal stress UspA family protein